MAAINNPPPVLGYVKQAIIADGPQQANSPPAPVPESTRVGNENQKNELSEAEDGEQLDFGAKSQASDADTAMATVGEIHGTED